MNFLRREEGDPADRGRRGGEDESTNRAGTGPGVQATDWSGPYDGRARRQLVSDLQH